MICFEGKLVTVSYLTTSATTGVDGGEIRMDADRHADTGRQPSSGG